MDDGEVDEREVEFMPRKEGRFAFVGHADFKDVPARCWGGCLIGQPLFAQALLSQFKGCWSAISMDFRLSVRLSPR